MKEQKILSKRASAPKDADTTLLKKRPKSEILKMVGELENQIKHQNLERDLLIKQ